MIISPFLLLDASVCILDERHQPKRRRRNANTTGWTFDHPDRSSLRCVVSYLFVSGFAFVSSSFLDLPFIPSAMSRSTAISIVESATLLEWHQQLFIGAFLLPSLREHQILVSRLDAIAATCVLSSAVERLFERPCAIEFRLLSIFNGTLHRESHSTVSNDRNSQFGKLFVPTPRRFYSVETFDRPSIIECLSNKDRLPNSSTFNRHESKTPRAS